MMLHRGHLGFVFVEVVLPAVVPAHPRPHGEALRLNLFRWREGRKMKDGLGWPLLAWLVSCAELLLLNWETYRKSEECIR